MDISEDDINELIQMGFTERGLIYKKFFILESKISLRACNNVPDASLWIVNRREEMEERK